MSWQARKRVGCKIHGILYRFHNAKAVLSRRQGITFSLLGRDEICNANRNLKLQ